jgi:metacaspase-1
LRQSNELGGCINDARNMERFLCGIFSFRASRKFAASSPTLERFGYRREDIVVLTDDQHDPRSVPTKANIVNLFL